MTDTLGGKLAPTHPDTPTATATRSRLSPWAREAHQAGSSRFRRPSTSPNEADTHRERPGRGRGREVVGGLGRTCPRELRRAGLLPRQAWAGQPPGAPTLQHQCLSPLPGSARPAAGGAWRAAASTHWSARTRPTTSVPAVPGASLGSCVPCPWSVGTEGTPLAPGGDGPGLQNTARHCPPCFAVQEVPSASGCSPPTSRCPTATSLLPVAATCCCPATTPWPPDPTPACSVYQRTTTRSAALHARSTQASRLPLTSRHTHFHEGTAL